MKNKEMKKIIGLMIGLTIGSGILTGCGNQTSSVQTTAAQTTGEKIETNESKTGEEHVSGTINFYYWDAVQTEAMNKVIEMFKEKNPDITVVATQSSW